MPDEIDDSEDFLQENEESDAESWEEADAISEDFLQENEEPDAESWEEADAIEDD